MKIFGRQEKNRKKVLAVASGGGIGYNFYDYNRLLALAIAHTFQSIKNTLAPFLRRHFFTFQMPTEKLKLNWQSLHLKFCLLCSGLGLTLSFQRAPRMVIWRFAAQNAGAEVMNLGRGSGEPQGPKGALGPTRHPCGIFKAGSSSPFQIMVSVTHRTRKTLRALNRIRAGLAA